jgi:transcription antitermination factor NusG
LRRRGQRDCWSSAPSLSQTHNCRPAILGLLSPSAITGLSLMTKQWYALQVYAGREKYIASHLENSGLEHLLLLRYETRRWSDRLKSVETPAFPGYIFCHMELGNRIKALSAPGVLKIVGYGKTSVPVADEEIAALQILNRRKLQLEAWPYLREGDQVRLEGGSLDGLTGRFVEERGRFRVVVSVTILQRSVAVEIDRSRLTQVTYPREPLAARNAASREIGPDNSSGQYYVA